jgi:hypothetical protein
MAERLSFDEVECYLACLFRGVANYAGRSFRDSRPDPTPIDGDTADQNASRSAYGARREATPPRVPAASGGAATELA